MGFQVSPGVQVIEKDLTNVIPAVSTSVGAIVGAFQWGPVEEVVSVGSEKDLVSWFGKPDEDTAKYFWPCAQFLQYGNQLRVVRADTNHLNAAATGTGIKVKNDEHYLGVSFATGDTFVAKYPGTRGNSLTVEMCTSSTAFAGWQYKGLFESAPNTSDYTAAVSGTNDELHIVVVDTLGEFTGTAGTILETFGFLSQASDAKTSDGSNNYYKTVINNSSRYVWWGDHDAGLTNAGNTAANTTFVTNASVDVYALSGGTSDNAPTVGELQLGYDLFADAGTTNINLLIGTQVTGADAVTLANYLIAIAEDRKDVVAFVSPDIADTVNNATAAADLITWADQLTSSSYAVLDSTALYVYDKYNDTYRWTVAAGSIAGICARTDDVSDPWFSPAGFTRGQLLGVTKIAYNPQKSDRDDLYKARVNPIVSFPGEGIVLYGDKTALSKPSAFDRINVRRLFITLEKAVSTAAKYQLFEFNDEFTRAQFRNMVEPFLRDIQGRRGVTDFAVICDETNNTGEVVDSNSFVADIYIKPTRSINFITLNFIATRTGVEFSEIVGQ